ncbi:hypothetical protein FA461_34155, partial [Pseudomonas aeruginosa]|nr:hypothetical protein [Pseudomonas aeruginosa]
MSKELNKAPVEQAGGDELEKFLAWANKEYEVEEGYELNESNTSVLENKKGWMARAALAQPSPAQAEQAEAERPEAVAWQYRVTAGPQTGWSLWHPGKGEEFERSYTVERRPLMTVAQYDRIVGELRAVIAQLRQHKNDYMDSGQETYRALQNEIREREAEIARLDGLVSGRTAERDAALAQPSPAQTQPSPAPTLRAAIDVANDRFEVPVAKWGTDLVGEEERPEVAEVAFVLRNIGAMDAEDIDGDNVDLRFEDAEGRDTGCDVSIVEYAEKAADLFEQHDRIVGELRADRDSWAEQAEQRLADWDEMRKERDAALARVSGLRSLLNPILCYV